MARPRRNPRSELSRKLPLFERFPALESVPRVALGTFPTPVVHLRGLSPDLWIKRDDLCANPIGGNKVRALEFLLGNVERDQEVVTVGSEGSTHALAVATYGKRLGARVRIGRWRQEMNEAAEHVSRRIEREVDRGKAPVFRSPAIAYAWATRERLRGARWIAAGGSTPLGVLGHVNAGLELVKQIDDGVLAAPSAVVVPLGTGGTAAGLALAFAIAGRSIGIVGARVVPWVIARRSHVFRLVKSTASLIERLTGDTVPGVNKQSFEIVHDAYGGAYGRVTNAGQMAAERLRTGSDVKLDGTYSAKAFAVALARAEQEPTLFWLTFDPRILDSQ